MPIQATNNFVFLVTDEAESEIGGLFIPDDGKEKPNRGEIKTVGGEVKDTNIQNGVGKKCLFPKGVGFVVEEEGIEYLVVEGERIFAVV